MAMTTIKVDISDAVLEEADRLVEEELERLRPPPDVVWACREALGRLRPVVAGDALAVADLDELERFVTHAVNGWDR